MCTEVTYPTHVCQGNQSTAANKESRASERIEYLARFHSATVFVSLQFKFKKEWFNKHDFRFFKFSLVFQYSTKNYNLKNIAKTLSFKRPKNKIKTSEKYKSVNGDQSKGELQPVFEKYLPFVQLKQILLYRIYLLTNVCIHLFCFRYVN